MIRSSLSNPKSDESGWLKAAIVLSGFRWINSRLNDDQLNSFSGGKKSGLLSRLWKYDFFKRIRSWFKCFSTKSRVVAQQMYSFPAESYQHQAMLTILEAIKDCRLKNEIPRCLLETCEWDDDIIRVAAEFISRIAKISELGYASAFRRLNILATLKGVQLEAVLPIDTEPLRKEIYLSQYQNLIPANIPARVLMAFLACLEVDERNDSSILTAMRVYSTTRRDSQPDDRRQLELVKLNYNLATSAKHLNVSFNLDTDFPDSTRYEKIQMKSSDLLRRMHASAGQDKARQLIFNKAFEKFNTYCARIGVTTFPLGKLLLDPVRFSRFVDLYNIQDIENPLAVLQLLQTCDLEGSNTGQLLEQIRQTAQDTIFDFLKINDLKYGKSNITLSKAVKFLGIDKDSPSLGGQTIAGFREYLDLLLAFYTRSTLTNVLRYRQASQTQPSDQFYEENWRRIPQNIPLDIYLSMTALAGSKGADFERILEMMVAYIKTTSSDEACIQDKTINHIAAGLSLVEALNFYEVDCQDGGYMDLTFSNPLEFKKSLKYLERIYEKWKRNMNTLSSSKLVEAIQAIKLLHISRDSPIKDIPRWENTTVNVELYMEELKEIILGPGKSEADVSTVTGLEADVSTVTGVEADVSTVTGSSLSNEMGYTVTKGRYEMIFD